MATHFCPFCWREVEERADRCPACGADLAAFSSLTYEDKLLLALEHPVREHRLTPIRVLGRTRSTRAVPRLQEMLKTEHDFYLLREVLEALAHIDSLEAREALSAARLHSSTLVRHYAEALAQAPTPVPRDEG